MNHLFLAEATAVAGEAVENSGNVIISLKKGATVFMEKLPEFASTLLLIAVIIFKGHEVEVLFAKERPSDKNIKEAPDETSL